MKHYLFHIDEKEVDFEGFSYPCLTFDVLGKYRGL